MIQLEMCLFMFGTHWKIQAFFLSVFFCQADDGGRGLRNVYRRMRSSQQELQLGRPFLSSWFHLLDLLIRLGDRARDSTISCCCC